MYDDTSPKMMMTKGTRDTCVYGVAQDVWTLHCTAVRMLNLLRPYAPQHERLAENPPSLHIQL